jgi:hypothetical protein
MLARTVPIAASLTLLLGLLGGLGAAGCEKPSHDNLDKWLTTAKGPGKLKAAFAQEGLDPDLSAHAGANLIRRQQDPDFRAVLEAMSPARHAQVIPLLAPRLWAMARVEDPAHLPTPEQVAAKDALVAVRRRADAAARATIDGFLLDWYAVISYQGRARAGGVSGAAVLRMIGPAAAPRMIAVVNAIIGEAGQDQMKNSIHDELLLALAVAAAPESVKHVLDIARLDRGDKTLATRALTQLYTAYVDSGGLVEIVPPAPLVPSLPAIVALARDPQQPGVVVNHAIALIRAVGGQTCVDQLVPLIAAPHRGSKLRYVAGTFALRCGGADAIALVLRAMPDPAAYEQAELPGTLLLEITRMPRERAQAALRPLLAERSAVAAWLAAEALAAIKSTDDAARVAALGKRTERLLGFWGDSGKPDPTLGARAKELAAELGAAK